MCLASSQFSIPLLPLSIPKSSLLALCFLLISQLVIGQKVDKIIEEGKRLYSLERTAWIATDYVVNESPETVKSLGGYFALPHFTSGYKCVFYDSLDSSKALVTAFVSTTFQIDSVQYHKTPRPLLNDELKYLKLRERTIKEVYSNKLFEQYENSRYNIVPLLKGGKPRVYVLTGPLDNQYVLFGNDYKLSFNRKLKLKKSEKLHENLIPVQYGGEEPATTLHTHSKSTGKLITATDVCTLLLYGQRANWEQHIIISEKKVTIWNVSDSGLITLDRKVFDMILEE